MCFRFLNKHHVWGMTYESGLLAKNSLDWHVMGFESWTTAKGATDCMLKSQEMWHQGVYHWYFRHEAGGKGHVPERFQVGRIFGGGGSFQILASITYIPGQITGEVLMLDKHHPTLVDTQLRFLFLNFFCYLHQFLSWCNLWDQPIKNGGKLLIIVW